ncbi:hypothetical protein [Acidiluteibacter ferrifornacis]|uniref:Uncharacterized protein n=1 Tax=Acidiluteibacter ferrifornacis TaxID=2692424 RepID=A0A6N9NKX6_9FLAO|nr:hypothetical protein [Acidiluteibacter ferrifornacis]NBG67358.1 hypothetical protein [Acidiluteibacter ferrifornacis]
MEDSNIYIRKEDFHESRKFIKINRDIDVCLVLIEKLLSFNRVIWKDVTNALKIPSHIIDYRVEQFGYFENTLQSIFYNCYSLKNFYDVSTYMNYKGINNTLGHTFNNQRRYITFNAIVKMSSIFEFTRKEYERTIKGKNYFEKMALKHSDLARSVELLNHFRNTIHSNGIWDKEGKKKPLEYNLREGKQIIKSGEPFKYDHWQLYRIIKDSIELHKVLALNNEAMRLRKSRLSVNGQQLSILKTDLNF